MFTKEMVNINSFEAEAKPTNILREIFNKQKELMDKYWTKPVGDDIDTLKGSQEIRKYSKYTCEELAEAYEAKDNKDHMQEELIDALHFLVEKLQIANLTFDKILHYTGYSEDNIWKMVKNTAEDYKMLDMEYYFWKAAYWTNIPDNRLRNKEWKNEQIATNRDLFYKECSKWFFAFLIALYNLGIDEPKLRDLYSRKNQVNHFRINSNY